jgi:hypothetical protein
MGTNDALQGLDPKNARPPNFPSTDVAFVDAVEDSAIKLGRVFSRRIALIGFGPSTVRCPKADRFGGSLPIPAAAVITSTDIQAFVHRAHIIGLIRSARENNRLQNGEVLTVVHTPMTWLPISVMQRAQDKLGHVVPRFYGDLAVEFVNCVLHGRRKFDKQLAVRYLLCPGLPPRFVDSYGNVEEAVHPREVHTHEGADAGCFGEAEIRPWDSPGGRLDIIWTDNDGVDRTLYGETYATPMYLD